MEPEDIPSPYTEDTSKASTSVGSVQSSLAETQTEKDNTIPDTGEPKNLTKCSESVHLVSRDESIDDLRTYIRNYERSRVYDDPSQTTIDILKDSFKELHFSKNNFPFESEVASLSASYRELFKPSGLQIQLLRERLLKEAMDRDDDEQHMKDKYLDEYLSNLSYDDSQISGRTVTLENPHGQSIPVELTNKIPFLTEESLKLINCKPESIPYKVNIVTSKDDSKKKCLVFTVDISDPPDPPCCPPPSPPPCCPQPPPPPCCPPPKNPCKKELVMAIKEPTCSGGKPCYYLADKTKLFVPTPEQPEPPCCPPKAKPVSCPTPCCPPPPTPPCLQPPPPSPPCCHTPCPHHPSPPPPAQAEEPEPEPPADKEPPLEAEPEPNNPCKKRSTTGFPFPDDKYRTVKVDPFERLCGLYESAREKTNALAATVSKEMCRQLRLCDGPKEKPTDGNEKNNSSNGPCKKNGSVKVSKIHNTLPKPPVRNIGSPCYKMNRIKSISNENCRKTKQKASEKCKSCSHKRSCKDELLEKACIKVEPPCLSKNVFSDYYGYNKYDTPTPRAECCEPRQVENVFQNVENAPTSIFTTLKTKIFEIFGDPDKIVRALSTDSMINNDPPLIDDESSDDSFSHQFTD